MARLAALTGNNAAAEAIRQIKPDVFAAYPITPQTEMAEEVAQFVADGILETEYIPVESEHSSMSVCIGASLAGVRAMTATASCGLAYMWELLPIAASMRSPVVMAVVNRAFNAPLNIHCSHDDSMGARDAGWIQLYSENAQEMYDNLIQAVKIAEDETVRLPVMVCMDGFIISHAVERLILLDDEEVKNFLGEFKPTYSLLEVNNPVTLGACALPDYYTEHKKQHSEALRHSLGKIMEVTNEYANLSGRSYSLFESYQLADAEYGIVILNSAAGVTRTVVDKLRKVGVKAGLLKIRVYRPFPAAQIVQALKNLKAVAVLERTDSFGGVGSPVFTDISAAFMEAPTKERPLMINYIYGLGGRDVGLEDIEKVYASLQVINQRGKIEKSFAYLQARE